jgi:hypothetical protein
MSVDEMQRRAVDALAEWERANLSGQGDRGQAVQLGAGCVPGRGQVCAEAGAGDVHRAAEDR